MTTKRTGRAEDGIAIPERVGIAALTRAAFSGADLDQIGSQLLLALSLDPADAGALMDLSVVEQLKGNPGYGLDLQTAALELSRCFGTISRSTGTGAVRVLAIAAPIHMGGNTPVEFLTTGADISLTTLYVVPGMLLPNPLPEHDLAFVVAPGDSNEFRRFLTEIDRCLADWPRPVLNRPCDIMKLERDSLSDLLANVPGLKVPKTARCDRGTLAAMGEGNARDGLAGIGFPVVVRPVGAHAGRNLDRLAGIEEVGAYLETCDDPDFFLSEYIDYGSADGRFRKYRVVFVDGEPFPCHMAIADAWKVWYMNAEMENSPAKRGEEERFMANFREDFAMRHRDALATVADRLGLDYFGIDCAEDRDGTLVLFEADNALIVHDMDPEDVYPYKKPRMHEIFRAFRAMAKRRSGMDEARARRRITA